MARFSQSAYAQPVMVMQVAGEVTAKLVRYPDQLAVITRTGSSASSTGLIKGS
jgi:hypothetical protein